MDGQHSWDMFDEDELESGMIEWKLCLNCGKEISQNRTGRPKRFCCEGCRREYGNRNQTPERWASYEKLICPICGRIFYAKKVRHRRYCSKSCSNYEGGCRCEVSF